MTFDIDRLRRAVALSLANDGHIDLSQHDGETYLWDDPDPYEGWERSYVREMVESAADSIARWYDADQASAIAEIHVRNEEGRN